MNHVRDTGGGMYRRIDRLTESEYHELLAVERRRTALDILASANAPVTLEELAATVAERESGPDIPDEATIERVAITLHHNHLPKMADVGAIDYDPDTPRVES
jgi:hypothetical protein